MTVRRSVFGLDATTRHRQNARHERREDDWLCYVGTPDRSYRGKDGRHDAPWPDEVFLVFVNADRVVYNWYWAKCDPDDRKLPIDYGTRFGRRVL